jgi:hypothetical protein
MTDETDPKPDPKNLPPDPDEVLVPKLDDRFALSRGQFLMLIGLCAFFMYYNYMRLFHSDFWGHVSYGQWMVEHKELPTEELFVPVAKGVPVVATAWGSQVILGLISQAQDMELFSHLWAICVLTVWLLLARAFYLQTRNGPVSLLAALFGWAIWWSRHAVIRPEIFGTICFAILVLLMVKADSSRSRRDSEIEPIPLSLKQSIYFYIGVALLFALWANLHGSFIVGFGVLGAYVAGRATELLWRTRDIQSLFTDAVFRQRVITIQAAVLGVLANPYGIDLFVHTLMFPSNPNLKDVWEWFPLKVVSLESPAIVFSWALLVCLLRHSKRRVAPTDVWMFLVFNAAVCLRVRMLQWYAPVVMLTLAPHLADCVERIVAKLKQTDMKSVFDWLEIKSLRLSLFGGLLLWMTFCFSPISRSVLGGKPRMASHVFSSDTPRGVSQYLRENPPKGLVATPQWWGDWIVWDGPKDIEVLMTTNAVHVAPPIVWKDYLAIAQGDEGLTGRLDRYRINTIVVCKELQRGLLRKVRDLPGWKITFEDERGLVAFRSHLAPVPKKEKTKRVAAVSKAKPDSATP